MDRTGDPARKKTYGTTLKGRMWGSSIREAGASYMELDASIGHWGMDTEKESTDEVLWPRIVNGDGEAFGKLFDRNRDRVLAHCLNIVASRQMALDVVAMVFYEAWQRRTDVRIVNGAVATGYGK